MAKIADVLKNLEKVAEVAKSPIREAVLKAKTEQKKANGSERPDAYERTHTSDGRSRIGGHRSLSDEEVYQQKRNQANSYGYLNDATREVAADDISGPAGDLMKPAYDYLSKPGTNVPKSLDYTYDKAGGAPSPATYITQYPMANSVGALSRPPVDANWWGDWDDRVSKLDDSTSEKAKDALGYEDYETDSDLQRAKTLAFMEETGYEKGFADFYRLDPDNIEAERQRVYDFMHYDPQTIEMYDEYLKSLGYENGIDDAWQYIDDVTQKSWYDILDSDAATIAEYFGTTNPEALRDIADQLAYEGYGPQLRGSDTDKNTVYGNWDPETEAGRGALSDANYDTIALASYLAAQEELKSLPPEQQQQALRDLGYDQGYWDALYQGTDVTGEYVPDVTGEYEEHTAGQDPELYNLGSFDTGYSLNEPIVLDAAYMVDSMDEPWFDPSIVVPGTAMTTYPGLRGMGVTMGQSIDTDSKRSSYYGTDDPQEQAQLQQQLASQQQAQLATGL